jgi:hypothetical protein
VLELLSRHATDMIACAVGADGGGRTERFIDARKCDGSTALHLAAQTNQVRVRCVDVCDCV